MKLSNGKNIIKKSFGRREKRNWLRKLSCLLLTIVVTAAASLTDAGTVLVLADDFAFTTTSLESAVEINDSSDLSKFIDDAKLLQDGEEVDLNGKVIVGEHYQYTVKFKEDNSRSFITPMYFQLPENVRCEAQGKVEIYDKDYENGDKPAGFYSIDENGLVTFEFYKEYLDSRSGKELGATFDLTVADMGDGKVTEFPWKGGQTHRFTTESASDAKLTKTMGEYNPIDPDGPCIDYTVELEITKGGVNNPQITDNMKPGLSYRPGSGQVIVYDEKGNDITEELDPKPTLKQTENGWEVENLPKSLSKGQKVVVTYKSDVDFSQVEGNPDGGIYKFEADNTAAFTGDVPGEEGKKITRDDNVHETLKDKRIEKTGSYDKTQNNIDWEIVVGSGSANLQGTTVKDRLEGNQWIDQSKELEIKWKDENNSTIKTYKIPWSEAAKYGLKPVYGKGDLEGKIVGFDFTVPKEGVEAPGTNEKFWIGSDDDKDRKWEYGDKLKIEYYTEIASNTGEQYSNNATVDIDGKTFEDDADVGIGAGSISKNGSLHEDETHGEYIEYTVVVNIPSAKDLADMTGGMASHGSRFYLQDQLEFADVKLDDGNGERTVRYFVDNYPDPEDVTITVTPAGGEPISFTEGDGENQFRILRGGVDYTHSDEKDLRKTAREFRIVFNRYLGGKTWDKNDSYWTLEEPSTITVTYKIKTNSKLYLEDEQYSGTIYDTDLTVRDLLNQGQTLTNEMAGYGNGDKNSFKAKHKYKEYPQAFDVKKDAKILDHESGDLSDNEIEYRVTFNGFTMSLDGKYGTAPIDPTTFYLSDTFSSALEYVEGSLQVEVYAPDSNRHRYTFSYKDENGTDRSPEIKINDDGTTTLEAFARYFNYRAYQGSTEDDTRTSLFDYMRGDDKNANAKARDALYVFVYRLRVKDEYLNGSDLHLDNTATVHYNGASDSDKASVGFTPDVLVKNGTHVVDAKGYDIVKYSIEVNPAAIDMVTTGVDDYNPGRYTLIDTMDEILELRPDSVKVFCIEENGNRKVLTRVADQASVKPKEYNYVLQEAEDNTFKLILPDEQHIIIEYEAEVIAEHGTSVSVTNTVTMEGGMSISDSSDADFKVDGNMVTLKSQANMRLFKQDASTGNYIDGATFKLYSISEGGSINAEIGGDTYYFKEYRTLEPTALNGDSVGPEPDNDGEYYLLEETEAPNGYQLNEEPVIIVFAAKKEGDPTTVDVTFRDKVYNGLEIYYIVTGDNVITFNNEPGLYQLPETGGRGYDYLYLTGGIFTFLGALFLLNKRRTYAGKK